MQYTTGTHPDPFAPWGWSAEPIQLIADVQFQTCPDCGHCADVEEFEVFGADDGNVFCPKCWAEIPIVADVLEVPVSAAAARYLESESEPEPGFLF